MSSEEAQPNPMLERAYSVSVYPGEARDRPPQPARPYTYDGLRETWEDDRKRGRHDGCWWTRDEAMAAVQSAAADLPAGVPVLVCHPYVNRGPLGEPTPSMFFELIFGGSPIEWEGVTLGGGRVVEVPAPIRVPESKQRAWFADWRGGWDVLWMIDASSGVDAEVRARAIRACLHRTAAWLREHLLDADRARLEALDRSVADGVPFAPDGGEIAQPHSLGAAIELYARATAPEPTATYRDVLEALLATARATGGAGCLAHDHDLQWVLRREIPLGAAMLSRATG